MNSLHKIFPFLIIDRELGLDYGYMIPLFHIKISFCHTSKYITSRLACLFDLMLSHHNFDHFYIWRHQNFLLIFTQPRYIQHALSVYSSDFTQVFVLLECMVYPLISCMLKARYVTKVTLHFVWKEVDRILTSVGYYIGDI